MDGCSRKASFAGAPFCVGCYVRGELNGRAKVTYEQVKQIMGLYGEGTRIADLARQFHVCWSTIEFIVKDGTWKATKDTNKV